MHFVITLRDLYYNDNEQILKESNEYKLSFDSPTTGSREYDNMILNYCYDEPKSRKEIMEYIGIVHRNHFTWDILNPLLKIKLL